MSNAGWQVQALLGPISEERPCGESLEDLPPLTSLDALRLFGQSRSVDAQPEDEGGRKPPDWGEVRGLALEGLEKSRDLRLLAHLAAALLRTDGLAAYLETLAVASHWLETYWEPLHPVVDDDAMARRNALNCFADPMAVLDRLRRTAVVESRQHGRFGLRDIEIAKGTLTPGASDGRPDMAQVDAAFGEAPIEHLTRLLETSSAALTALRQIDARMRDQGGPDMAPSFEALTPQISRLQLLVQAEVTKRTPEEIPEEETPGVAGTAGGPTMKVGAIGSRQDAIRALDAVVEYFRRNEPSSPVPLMIERAKRLVSKSFLEVLEDIAPDAVSVARAVGGLKDGD